MCQCTELDYFYLNKNQKKSLEKQILNVRKFSNEHHMSNPNQRCFGSLVHTCQVGEYTDGFLLSLGTASVSHTYIPVTVKYMSIEQKSSMGIFYLCDAQVNSGKIQ